MLTDAELRPEKPGFQEFNCEIVQKQALINNRSTRFDRGALCAFTGTLTKTISNALEQPDLRLDSKNSPETASMRGALVQISQNSFARDTKWVWGESFLSKTRPE
jgi:hypothetical protein